MKGGGVTSGRCSPGWEYGVPLGLCWVDRGRATVCLVVVARVDQLLSKSFLSFKAAPLGPWLFWGIFSFVLVFSWLPTSSASSLGYISQSQNPGNSFACHSSGPRIPSWLAFLSTFQSLILFALYMLTGFPDIFSGYIGKIRWKISIFPEAEVLGP